MKTYLKLLSVLNILVLCTIISFVSIYFIYDQKFIGIILIGLGILCLVSLKLFSTKISLTYPDVIFGIIDNGILAIMAVIGAEFAGIIGAILGGVVGNAITDGIAGIFEGYWAESRPNDHRTILGSAVGKMAGCLFGAGAVLAIVELI